MSKYPLVLDGALRSVARSARVTLRQLCHLDLPAPVLLPSLLPALRGVVPASHAAFFYCDAGGHLYNLYAERMLPPETMAKYYDKRYRSGEGAFAQAYLARVAASDPVSSRTMTSEDRATEYYGEVMGVLGVGHVLYGIVRSPDNAGAPIGQMSLYRGVDARPFSATDATALRDVLRYLGRALSEGPYGKPLAASEQSAEEAMAVLDERGEVLLADGSWLRLTRMARGETISPGQARQEPDALRAFLCGVAQAVRTTKQSPYVVNSAWGQFAFRQHDLAGASGNSATGLVVSRRALASVRLAEGAARLDLTSQQREVALMIALGRTNAEIAETLGVSVNTVGYHVKRLFAKLDIHERGEVARLLLQG